MKKLIVLTLASLVSLSAAFAQADDHASSGPLFYGQSFGFVAEDAPAVVAAMDKWRNSKAGKSGPNTVVLTQNIANGDYKSTHGVNVFYPNGAAMDASMAISIGSKGWAEFQATMNKLAEPEWENMYAILRAKANEGDVSSKNPVSIIYGFTVTDPADFMVAFDTFWESSSVQNFPGNVYLGQSLASGTMAGTHFVTWVADSQGKLMEAMTALRASKDLAAYMGSASGKRTLEATNMSMEVKRWANGG
jgi:hypothetical protein